MGDTLTFLTMCPWYTHFVLLEKSAEGCGLAQLWTTQNWLCQAVSVPWQISHGMQIARGYDPPGTDLPCFQCPQQTWGRWSAVGTRLVPHGQLNFKIQLPLAWTRQESYFIPHVPPWWEKSAEDSICIIFFGSYAFSTWSIFWHRT